MFSIGLNASMCGTSDDVCITNQNTAFLCCPKNIYVTPSMEGGRLHEIGPRCDDSPGYVKPLYWFTYNCLYIYIYIYIYIFYRSYVIV